MPICSKLLKLSILASIFLATGALSKEHNILFIGKLRHEFYWSNVESGAKQAAKDLQLQLEIKGENQEIANPYRQAQYIEQGIKDKVDAIVFAALDNKITDPYLLKARKQGIKVIAFDSDSAIEARDYFVNQVDPTLLAIAMLENMNLSMLKLNKTKANIIILVSEYNTSNQNLWLEYLKAVYYSNYDIPFLVDGSIDYVKAKENMRTKEYSVREAFSRLQISFHPDGGIVYAGHGVKNARNALLLALEQKKNVDGIMILTTNAIFAVNEALKKEEYKNIIFNGVALPSEAMVHLDSGKMSAAILWQPYDLGYLSINVAKDALEHNISAPYISLLSSQEQVKGESIYSAYGHKIIGREIILGSPIIFNSANAHKLK